MDELIRYSTDLGKYLAGASKGEILNHQVNSTHSLSKHPFAVDFGQSIKAVTQYNSWNLCFTSHLSSFNVFPIFTTASKEKVLAPSSQLYPSIYHTSYSALKIKKRIEHEYVP